MTGNASILDAANRENLRLLILLRWIAVVGQVVTIATVSFVIRIDLPIPAMAFILAALVAWNGVSILRWRSGAPVSNLEIFVGLLADVLALTGQLYLSGGAANPFVTLFLLQVILGVAMLEFRLAGALTVVTAAAFIGLAFRSIPLAMSEAQQVDFLDLHIQGTFICFLLTAGLLLVFLARIASNQRQTDQRLAELRQRAVEEDHVMRMGLLAAGAAHELGTPLATLSVILGDWRRLPFFKRDDDARQELQTMAAELERCKAIVSGILVSSGELRGEGTVRTTVRAFLDELVGEWQASRPVPRLVFVNAFAPDAAMVSDLALKQVVANLLDNALDASPHEVRIEARRDGEALRIAVTDAGPGFDENVLARIGSPYISTKNKPGGGLGLFLVTNVARTLGGSVQASNPEGGGACVVVTLPLSALGPTS
ncbi:ATP-binding protein [Brevundimonas sp.]|uniref:ATP-binding protein n=1 Tax=Brevundimonas sp. TaxID=1871086 RepID=UPI0026307E5C|nr:ATP-binding protein [Brevundimonas sp.]